ncbi:RNA methyltransferase [Natronorarus salvus]|uniref:RNA methyltransferase n=1 Tax=Natronorarus salvus TaxID=3117733 RepID=UPI002F26D370
MSRVPTVCVVGAKTPGNVGTIARAMKNFGFSELLLVDPPELAEDGEAYGFAGHAREDVLPNAEEIAFEELVTGYHTVGFTATTNEDATKHVRYPFSTPAELRDRLAALDAPTALVFGRERIGLTNEEFARIDEVCSIPANPEYPVLNLGQAATVALYELRDLALSRDQLPPTYDRADEREIEQLYTNVDSLLRAIEYPEGKRPKTIRMVRRILGRAHPTDREIRTLHGVVRRCTRAAEVAYGNRSAPSGSRDDRD